MDQRGSPPARPSQSRREGDCRGDKSCPLIRIKPLHKFHIAPEQIWQQYQMIRGFSVNRPVNPDNLKFPTPFTSDVARWLEAEKIRYSYSLYDGFCKFKLAGTRELEIICIDFKTWMEPPRNSQSFKTGLILWEDVWYRKNDIVKSRLHALLGNSVRISARLTHIERIDKPTAHVFLEDHHMNGTASARYRYGLFLPEKHFYRIPSYLTEGKSGRLLVAVAAFAAPRTFNRNGVSHKSGELIRFSSLKGTTVVGGLNKLTDHFARQYKTDDIVTYIDREWSEGTSFHKSGFELSGQTDPIEFIVDRITYQRLPLHRIDNKIFNAWKETSVKIYNAGSLKFTKTYPPDFRYANNSEVPEMTDFDSKPPYDIIFVVGPTASGKTALAVRIAYELGGSIISLDSRQLYKNMDIGSGKDLNEYHVDNQTIPYYLIDLLEPGTPYNVHLFKNDFLKVYRTLRKKMKPVIACGGSGLYIEAVLKLLSVEHNKELPPPSVLIIGINPPTAVRNERIEIRLKKRLEEGMIREVKSLIENGVPEEVLIKYGLEYKYVTLFLRKEISYEEMTRKLFTEIRRFAKRQVTFLKRLEKRGYRFRWL